MRHSLSGKSRVLLGALGIVAIGGVYAATEAAAPTAPHLAPVPAIPPVPPMPPAPPAPPAVPVLAGMIRSDVRASLNQARASILAAPGMREQDRRAALQNIDRAMSHLDPPREPELR